jgi:hypothetical protein
VYADRLREQLKAIGLKRRAAEEYHGPCFAALDLPELR